MADEPSTRTSLLLRIRDAQDAAAWQQFVRLYAPLVYAVARRRGLQDADAADLTQEVLQSVAVGRARLGYDRDRGSFRGWLLTLVRNRATNFLAARQHRLRPSGTDATRARLEEQPAPDDAALWEQEYQRQLLAQALERLRGAYPEPTWRAFWLTAVEGRPAAEAAQTLELSVAAVYKAKSRVVGRLRREVRLLREE
jgi:RNA polymerase sigma-70 factor (ECF subfamily)